MQIYQFLIAVRQGGGEGQLTNEAGEVTSHLTGMLYRTIRMMEAGIKPVRTRVPLPAYPLQLGCPAGATGRVPRRAASGTAPHERCAACRLSPPLQPARCLCLTASRPH